MLVASLADSSEELNFNRRHVHRLSEGVGLLAEPSWLQHHVAGGPLEIDIYSCLDIRIKLEERDWLIRSKRAGVLHPLFFPLLVVFEAEAGERIGLFQRLNGVTEEHKTFTHRESSTLGLVLRSDRKFIQAHPVVVSMGENEFRSSIVTSIHRIIVKQHSANYILDRVHSSSRPLYDEGQVNFLIGFLFFNSYCCLKFSSIEFEVLLG